MFTFLHSEYFGEVYPEEWAAAREVFKCVSSVENAQAGDVVIPRYRAIPFGDLLEAEVKAKGARLINSWEEHCAVDDIFLWSELLGDLTPKSYRFEEFEDAPEGEYFVKGQVNSLKNRGPQAVFADSKAAAVSLALEVSNDPWLASVQDVVIRPRQSYLRLGTSRNGLPVFNEQRAFFYKKEFLANGFYWESQNVSGVPELDSAFWRTVEAAIDRVGHLCSFLVIDFAQYEDGAWGAVELNDGVQSGIPTLSPGVVFRSLAERE